ncbi:MAG: DNA recombination protein RmuC [Spirochaetales bacterium]|nr:DNA recombination protein RmuC [Spirochaetales bacterium]
MSNQTLILGGLALVLAFQLIITGTLLLYKRKKETNSPELRLSQIEESIREISNIFKNPSKRANFGETELNNLLADLIPQNHFKTQYSFADGTRADSVVIINNKIVAIDSKFQYEKLLPYLQGESVTKAALIAAVRPHIEAISNKYIKPSEGTMNFALMFIPSEKIYYSLFVENPFLFEEATRQNVYPVGPYTIYLYLQTIAYGLRGLEISKHSKHILQELTEAQNQIEKTSLQLTTAAKQLNNFTYNFNEAATNTNSLLQRLKALSKRI